VIYKARDCAALQDKMGLLSVLGDPLFIVASLLVLQLGNQAGYIFLGVYRSEYFTWGPNPQLLFVGAPIDTWSKWWYLIASRVVAVVSEVALGSVIKAWIETYVQGSDKLYLPHAKWKCRIIVQIYSIYERINEMFSLFLILTQADVALVEIISQALVLQLWTLPRQLRRKEYLSRDTTIDSLIAD
jgi:hypothetical protein